MLSLNQKYQRMRGIGGSDSNILFGPPVRKWKPIDVYHSKVQPPRDDTEEELNEDQMRGTFLEPAILKWYAAKHKLLVTEPGTVVHPEHPGSDTEPAILATPDGLAEAPDGRRWAVEVKAPRFTMLRHWCDEGEFPDGVHIPSYYRPQLTWECAVLGVDHAEMVVLLGDEVRVLHQPFDPEYFADMVYLARSWWTRHVLARTPPEPDGSDAYHEWLSDKHPKNAGAGLLPATDDARRFAREYAAASAVIREAEKTRALARQHLESIIGDADGIDFGAEGKTTWKNDRDKTKPDWAAVERTLDPALLKPFIATRPGSRRFLCTYKGA